MYRSRRSDIAANDSNCAARHSAYRVRAESDETMTRRWAMSVFRLYEKIDMSHPDRRYASLCDVVARMSWGRVAHGVVKTAWNG